MVCDVCCVTYHFYVSCFIEERIWEMCAWRLTVLAISLSLFSIDCFWLNTAFKNYSRGFRYWVVTISNQNNLHEEFNSLVTNEEYIASDGTSFDS